MRSSSTFYFHLSVNMNCFSKFNTLSALSTYFRLLCNQKIVSISSVKKVIPVKQSRSYISCVSDCRSCVVLSEEFQRHRSVCFNTKNQRSKTSKTKGNKSSNKDDNDASDVDDDEEDEEDDESFSDIEPDYDAPFAYKHSLVHSLRVDIIVSKGLSMSNRETDNMFYGSKFLLGGKTLLKKAKKLNVGEHIDVVCQEEGEKLLVKRVKVIKTLNRLTKKGKPVIAVRVWKTPFAIDKPGS